MQPSLGACCRPRRIQTSTFNTMPQLLQACLRELKPERSTTTYPFRPPTLIPATLPPSPSPSPLTIACTSNTLTWIIKTEGFTCRGLTRPTTWGPCSSGLTTTAIPASTVTGLRSSSSSSSNRRHPKIEAIPPNLTSHLLRAARRCIRRSRRRPQSLLWPARISPTVAAAAAAATATATVPLANRLNISPAATRSFTHR